MLVMGKPSELGAEMFVKDAITVPSEWPRSDSWSHTSVISRSGEKTVDMFALHSHIHELQAENEHLWSHQAGNWKIFVDTLLILRTENF